MRFYRHDQQRDLSEITDRKSPFLAVRTGTIDIPALRRDRDQLWAEAAHVEATGLSLTLPEELWGDASVEQERRRDHDPWDDILAEVNGSALDDEERISTADLMTIYLKLPPDKQTDAAAKR